MKTILLFIFSAVTIQTTVGAQPVRLCQQSYGGQARRQFDYELREGDPRPKPDLTPRPNAGPARRSPKDAVGWQPNGIVVCDTSWAWLPKIASDGKSGAIICWTEQYRGADSANHANWDIYAQRVDSGGNFVWQSQGVPVCSLSGDNSTYPAMISDGKGGVILAWEDDRDGLYYTRVFAQRLDSLGNRLWPENGVLVCNQMSGYVDLCSDGHGGAIIAYVDGRDEAKTSDNIYAQRIDSAGNPAWQIDGVPVCTADSIQFYPHIFYTVNNGAIITWAIDERNGNNDAYAQLFNYLGNNLWINNGRSLFIGQGIQSTQTAVYNYFGGGLITWVNYETDSLYIQSYDSIGNIKWDTLGISFPNAGSLLPDIRGGAIGASVNYSNRIDSNGIICWGNGVDLHPGYLGLDGDACEDTYGGVIVIWEDERNNPPYTDLYIQRVDSNGTVLWNPTGVPVCTLEYDESHPKIIYDGLGGAICAWDYAYPGSMFPTYPDIVVHRVYYNGIPGGVVSTSSKGINRDGIRLSAFPNPLKESLSIEYSISISGWLRITITNIIGQRIRTIYEGYSVEGKYVKKWNGSDESGRRVSNGIYFCTIENATRAINQKLVIIK